MEAAMGLAKPTDRNVVAVEVFGPFGGSLISLVEKAAVVTKRLGKAD